MKKFLALFLAALMLLSLVACASDGQTEQAPATDTAKETQSTQQTVPSTEEAPAEAEQTGSVLADINGDGKITTLDYMKVNAYVKGTVTLTEYELKCADVIGTDGKVTTADAMRINAHVKGTKPLW